MTSKCMLIGGKECPETNTPTDKSKHRYCPHWVDAIPETSTNNNGEFVDAIYRGCFVRRLPQYLVTITARSGHAAASYDSARNVIIKTPEPMMQAMLTLGMSALAGGLKPKQLETNHDTQSSDDAY